MTQAPAPYFTYLGAALFFYNLVGGALMGWDKRQARRGAWRIPERTLFTLAFTGAALGILAGMYLFRHKTRHLSFVLGIPAIIALQLGVLVWLGR
ncbi:MAG: hypothetical protein PWP43_537 [Bacillota bacterium]|jgi:hypothetical protein|nr:hypothetical protein [Bacillota bacterium]